MVDNIAFETRCSDDPVTIWKYNALRHVTEHPDPDNSGQHKLISPEFQIKILIRKAEEKAMGIQEMSTTEYRSTHDIPDSEDILPEEEPGLGIQKSLLRAESTSTVRSQDSFTHHQQAKKTRDDLDNIEEDKILCIQQPKYSDMQCTRVISGGGGRQCSLSVLWRECAAESQCDTQPPK